MGKKSFDPIDVHVDELQLSLRGYDIADAQARLVYEYDTYDKEYEYEIHWSVRGRFNPDEWTDRFSGDWAPQLVPILRVPEMGPTGFVSWWGDLDRSKRAVKISERRDLWKSRKKIDPAGVSATVTAYDSVDVDYDPVPLEKGARTLPIEVVAEPADCGCVPLVQQVHASTACEPGDDDRFLQLLLSGGVQLCGLDEEREEYRSGLEYRRDRSYRYTEDHELPTLGIEILDESGFLLEEKDEAVRLQAEVDRLDGPPMRQPRWIYAERFPFDRYSDVPARVIARFRKDG